MSFSLLFDIDGVILKNKKLLHKVEKKCNVFCHKVIKKKLIKDNNISHPEELNKYLYTTHGHTLRGVFKEANYNLSEKLELNDLFNSTVYDAESFNYLNDHLMSINFFDEDFSSTLNLCVKNNINVDLFSNSSYIWSLIIANQINKIYGLKIGDVYSSDCKIINNEFLFKPDLELYKLVEENILKKNNNVKKILFIDDSIINVKGYSNQIWQPILYDCHTMKKIENLFYFKSI